MGVAYSVGSADGTRAEGREEDAVLQFVPLQCDVVGSLDACDAAAEGESQHHAHGGLEE